MSAFPADSALATEIRPAANHDERRGGRVPDILLLHYTGMRSGEAALEKLVAADSGVSCHYLVFEDGRTVQMVPEELRAWHAGISSWEGATDVNSRSIGIEIVNPGHEYGYRDFPEKQVAAVIELSRDICARRLVQPERVLGHSDVAPQRKQDPGELFPWDALAAEGVGHWIAPTAIEGEGGLRLGDEGEHVEELQTLFSLYGYGLEIDGRFDAATEAVIRAFQRHFRAARVDGVADFSTSDTLRNLLRALPPRST